MAEILNEQQLESAGLLMMREAQGMTIHSQAEYETAGQVLVEIKTKMKAVKDYWAKPKADAASAHKTLCEKEKEMLKPLAEAENLIKKTMAAYQEEMEKVRREAEEAARKARQEEIDRQLALSMAAQEEGDQNAAEAHMIRAEILDQVTPVVNTPAPSAAGTSVRKTWKARVVDPTLVPAYVNGIWIREINMSALNNLAKMSEGKLHIPGVEFYQDTIIAARS